MLLTRVVGFRNFTVLLLLLSPRSRTRHSVYILESEKDLEWMLPEKGELARET